MLVRTQARGFRRFCLVMGSGALVILGLLLGSLLLFGSRASAAAGPGQMQPDDLSYPLQEGFESGGLGAFHSAVAICLQGGCGWQANSIVMHSGYYSARVSGVAGESDQSLTLNGP